MLLDVIPLSELATRHIKHVINAGSVNHINNIWPYLYAIIWYHTISIFLIQYNTIWHIFNHICTIYTISNTASFHLEQKTRYAKPCSELLK